MKSKLRAADNWKGVWTALITPLEKKSGVWAIDKKSLGQLIERQLEDGIHGFVIAGSTGEGSLLTPSLYSDLLKWSRKIIGKRAYMVAGLGIGGTDKETQPQFGPVDSSLDGCSLQTGFEVCADVTAQIYFLGAYHH